MDRQQRSPVRQRPAVRMTPSVPNMLKLPENPFKGETKYASAALAVKRGGLGVFIKIKF